MLTTAKFLCTGPVVQAQFSYIFHLGSQKTVIKGMVRAGCVSETQLEEELFPRSLKLW